MTLNKWVIEYVQKYSFIKNVTLMGGTVLFYYEKDGKQKFKRLPHRATKPQLQRCIESIKKDVNFYENKKKRIKAGQYNVLTNNKPVFIILGDKQKWLKQKYYT